MPFKKIFETEALLHAQSDVVRVRDIGVFKVIGCFFLHCYRSRYSDSSWQIIDRLFSKEEKSRHLRFTNQEGYVSASPDDVIQITKRILNLH